MPDDKVYHFAQQKGSYRSACGREKFDENESVIELLGGVNCKACLQATPFTPDLMNELVEGYPAHDNFKNALELISAEPEETNDVDGDTESPKITWNNPMAGKMTLMNSPETTHIYIPVGVPVIVVTDGFNGQMFDDRYGIDPVTSDIGPIQRAVMVARLRTLADILEG